MTTNTPLAPLDAFPAVEHAQWLDLVRAETGRDPASLGATGLDGLALRPLYQALHRPAVGGAPGVSPYLRGNLPLDDDAEPVRHVVLQRHADDDHAALAAAVADDVDGGVTGLWLDLRASGIGSPAGLDAVLGGVDPTGLRRLALDGCSDGAGRLQLVVDWLAGREVDPAQVVLSLRLDPLGRLLRDGSLPGSLDDALFNAGEATTRCLKELPAALPLTLSAAPVMEGGGTVVHGLGWLLANAAWVLRGLEARGLDPAAVARRMELHLPLGRDVFTSIASIRALRLLWARFLDAAGLPASPALVHGSSSRTVLTARDPWVNALRVTTQVFAGMIGGADAITAAPWDEPLGVASDGARRLARNTHLVLGEESHLGAIVDPAGGSWFLEARTEQLAAAAWDEFTGMEAMGGAAELVTEGHLQLLLGAARTQRAGLVATREVPVTGVSYYPNLTEEVPDRRPHPTVDTADLGGVRVDPLPLHRDAAPWEALRDRADLLEPRAHLLTLGARPRWNARALWTADALRAGGFRVTEGEGGDLEDALAAVPEDADVVCIVAHDDRYPEAVPALLERLQAAGHAHVLVAGRAPDEATDAAWRGAGLTSTLNTRSVLLPLLAALQRMAVADRVETAR